MSNAETLYSIDNFINMLKSRKATCLSGSFELYSRFGQMFKLISGIPLQKIQLLENDSEDAYQLKMLKSYPVLYSDCQTCFVKGTNQIVLKIASSGKKEVTGKKHSFNISLTKIFTKNHFDFFVKMQQKLLLQRIYKISSFLLLNVPIVIVALLIDPTNAQNQEIAAPPLNRIVFISPACLAFVFSWPVRFFHQNSISNMICLNKGFGQHYFLLKTKKPIQRFMHLQVVTN